MSKEEKLLKGQRTAQQAFLLVALLSAAKAVIGFLSGSLVLISDAVHSGSDLVSVVTSWLGLKIAQRKPDERFPYGYYKAENLATTVVSTLILYAAYQIFTQGYSRLFFISPIKIPALALGVSLIDALVLSLFGFYETQVGKEINSQSLIALGEENKSHLFSSVAVFIGILAAFWKVPYLEGVITIAVSLLIFKIGLCQAKDSVFALMDVSPSREIEEKVALVIDSVPGIEEFFDLRLRNSGPFVFGETKVGVRKFIDVGRAHEIADRIEAAIKEKVPQVDSFVVHVEPFKSDFHHLVIPVSQKKGLSSLVASQFGRAPYFLFINLKAGKIKGYYFLKNPYEEEKVRAGLAAAKLIAKQKSDILITREIGEIAFYTLRDNLIDIYQTETDTAKAVVDQFIKGELEQIRQATRKKV